MNTLNTVYRRVNSRELPQMVGQNVRLVGKCLNADESGDFLLLETSDGGQVQIKRSHGSSMHQILSPFVEVSGQVEMDMSVTENSIVNYGSKLDLELYNKMLNRFMSNSSLQ